MSRFVEVQAYLPGSTLEEQLSYLLHCALTSLSHSPLPARNEDWSFNYLWLEARPSEPVEIKFQRAIIELVELENAESPSA